MNKLSILFLILLMAGCSSDRFVDRGDYKADTSFPAVGQNDRVSSLVLHYTALDDEKSIKVLTQGQVSAHYLVLEHPEKERGKPVVLQLVGEEDRAWHAGVSNWRGRSNLNDSSIGIEIVNLGYTKTFFGKKWYPFNQQQIELITHLTKDIVKRYKLDPTNVIAHSDIAPLRKSDPGPLFPWKGLASIGVGAWPDENVVKKYIAQRDKYAIASVSEIQKALAKYGYTIPQTGELDKETKRVISAFQMHFRPADFSGTPDVETEAIALALVEKYRSK